MQGHENSESIHGFQNVFTAFSCISVYECLIFVPHLPNYYIGAQINVFDAILTLNLMCSNYIGAQKMMFKKSCSNKNIYYKWKIT